MYDALAKAFQEYQDRATNLRLEHYMRNRGEGYDIFSKQKKRLLTSGSKEFTKIPSLERSAKPSNKFENELKICLIFIDILLPVLGTLQG
jgi:hypothetical protein